MIASFADRGTEDVHFVRSTRFARRSCPPDLCAVARRKLAVIDFAPTLDSLRIPPGNRLEELRGSRREQHSMRINDRYRICFRWTDGNAVDVEIVDHH